MNILKPFQDYFKRRDIRVLKGQIQIAQAKIKCESEVLQMKSGRQKRFELASIGKAKKKEMAETMQNNTFHEWIDLTKDDYSHWNVYQYYSYSEDLTKYTRDLEGLDSRWITDELENENVGTGSYELENPLCMGG